MEIHFANITQTCAVKIKKKNNNNILAHEWMIDVCRVIFTRLTIYSFAIPQLQKPCLEGKKTKELKRKGLHNIKMPSYHHWDTVTERERKGS